jgi:Tfp pilus assembly protein PilN
MSRWLDINLARPTNWRQSATAKTLAGLVSLLLLGLAVNGMRWMDLRQQISAEKVGSLSPATRMDIASSQPMTAEQVKRAAAMAQMLQQLATPWERLFSRTEGSLPEGLKLESLQAQPGQSKMLIKVAARDFPEIFLFLHRLRAQEGLESVQLKSQSFADAGNTPRWRATLEVQWSSGPNE